MRSMGAIYNSDGELKAAWTWNDPTQPCRLLMPIADGDELIIVDPDDPTTPDEMTGPVISQRRELLNRCSSRTRTRMVLRFTQEPDREYFITPSLNVVSKIKGASALLVRDEPGRVLERLEVVP